MFAILALIYTITFISFDLISKYLLTQSLTHLQLIFKDNATILAFWIIPILLNIPNIFVHLNSKLQEK